MASIQSLRRLGQGAIAANQRQIATTQNNIANATTPGYRRQRTSMETLGGQIGQPQSGVTTGARRSIDAPLVDRFVPQYRGEAGFHSARAEVATVAEGLRGAEGADLGQRVSSFFSAARTLEADPSDAIARREFLAQADAFAQGVQRQHTALHEMRDRVETTTSETVDHVNDLLGRIAAYDQQIMRGEGGPEAVDARDQLIHEVSEQIGTRVVDGKHGTVNLITAEGAALVEGGRARSLTMHKGVEGDLSLKLSNGRALADVGGRLGGLLTGTQEVIDKGLADLEQFATKFADEVNTIHSAGVGTDGVTGRALFTYDPASPGSTLRLAADVQDNPAAVAASDSVVGLPGDNTNLRALLDVQNAGVINGATPAEAALSMQTDIGGVVRDAEAKLETAQVSLNHIEDMQASVSGVSLEEEMIAMSEAQRAFEASTKLLRVADDLMETVLSLR